MGDAQPIGQVGRAVQVLSRQQCIERLLHFPELPLDFDRAYLEQMSEERLRHVLLAAVVTAHTRCVDRYHLLNRPAEAADTSPVR